MLKIPKVYYFLVIAVLALVLSGCQLRREGDDPAAPDPLSDVPPTLAPLGAETEMAVVTQSSAAVVVQPDGGVVTEQTEVTVVTEAAGMNSDTVEGAATSPETFTAPAAVEDEAVTEEAIVVDAADTLPTGGPVAASPPNNLTEGVYGASTYVVRAGDTLFGVAQQYGTSVDAIVAANGLSTDLIDIGQQLNIPSGEVAAYTAPAPAVEDQTYQQPAYDQQPAYEQPYVASGDGGYHMVAPGETLFRIALNYGSTVDAIAGANGIPYPYYINAGQQLVIPGANSAYVAPPPPQGGFYEQPQQQYQQPQQYEQPQQYQQPQQQYQQPQQYQEAYPQDNSYYPGNAGTHTVAPGETLFSISMIYGTSADALSAANGLYNPNQIYVGQVLYLP